MWALNRMPLEPPGPHRVPIHFQGQVVPGVEGEIVYSPWQNRWILPLEHYILLGEIVVKLRELTNNNNDFRPVPGQNYGAQGFIEYEIGEAPEVPDFMGPLPVVNPQPVVPPPEVVQLGYNNWNGEVAGPEVPNVPANPYAEIPVGAAKYVPAGAEDQILMRPFEAGEVMANFHGESGFGRYYSKEAFNSMELKGHPRRKENPFTRAPIEPGNVRFYKKAGGGRRKTKSKRKQQRRRKTARRHG